MQKKILFVDQYGSLGGGQRVLLDTLSALDPDQFQVTVALNGDGSFRRLLLSSGIPVIDLPLGDYRSGIKSLWDVARFGPRSLLCSGFLASLIVRNRFDLIFANGPRTFPSTILAGRLTKVPVLWHLHNAFPSGAMVKGLSILAASTSQIIACSKSAAAPFLKYRPDLRSKIRLIPNSIPNWPADPMFETVKWQESVGGGGKPLSFGIFGRITPFKGQSEFLKAAQLLCKRREKARFFVIGSPADNDRQDQRYYKELRNEVQNSDLQPHVTFIAHQDDVRRYYSLVDVVVLASQGAEALPQTLIEAMSLAKPVIAPAQGGVIEIVRNDDNGLLVESAKPDLLANRMLELLHDSEKRRVVGLVARNDVMTRFSREAFKRNIAQALTDCLESKVRLSEKLVNPLAVSKTQPRFLIDP
jgi:glycosyltransferase involved in cell wall biosynthesis